VVETSYPRIVITGVPGVGKSTVFEKLVDELRKRGLSIGGIKAPEVRQGGVRVGFKVVDLLTGEEAWLARKGAEGPVRIGSYTILVEEASKVVENALRNAMARAHVIGVDEVGPMELKIPVFKPLLLEALDSEKPIILVVHYRLHDREILGRLSGSERIVVTFENREAVKSMLGQIVEKILSSLKQYSSGK